MLEDCPSKGRGLFSSLSRRGDHSGSVESIDSGSTQIC